MSNNPPFAILELTEEEHKFLLDNCDSNIANGLAFLQVTENRATAEKLVDLMERFKAIRKKLKGI